jgi:hypothetical protein
MTQARDAMESDKSNSLTNLGTHYGIRNAFGTFSVVPLIDALAETLPIGARLCLVTPIGKPLKSYLRDNARRHGRTFLRREWHIEQLANGASLRRLSAFARSQDVKALSVWILAEAADNAPLVEAEDGNDYIWVSSTLPPSTHEVLVQSVGGAISKVEPSRSLS